MRDAAGKTAVDAAIALPVAILLLAGIAQAGYMLVVYDHLLDVAQEVSRRVAIEPSTAAEAETWAEGELSNYGSVVVTVTETADEIATSISIPLTSIALIDPLGVFTSGSLRAVATTEDPS